MKGTFLWTRMLKNKSLFASAAVLLVMCFVNVGVEASPQAKSQAPSKRAPATTTQRPAPPACCTITAIDEAAGIVTAKVNATGQTFQFTAIYDAFALLGTLRIGQSVYANFPAMEVSLNGASVCCKIVSSTNAREKGKSGGNTPGTTPPPKFSSQATGQSAVSVPAAGNLGNAANPGNPCCNITGVNVTTGVITARVNSTGQTFQFQVKDSAQLKSLQSGQAVWANFKTNQVSVDGLEPCCNITSQGAIPAAGRGNFGNAANPGEPCCEITGVNVTTGMVTARVNSTGQTFQFQVKDSAQLKSLQSGQAVWANFKTNQVSVDGLEPCCNITSQGAISVAGSGNFGNAANPANPCCQITGVNVTTGVVTARVNSTGESFQFQVKDSALLNSLRAGEAVWANFNSKQVSLNGAEPCCQITTEGATPVESVGAAKNQSLGPVAKAGSAGRPMPAQPCCQIISISATTGIVTAKVNATGQAFQFKAGSQQQSLKVGQGIFANLKTKQVSVNGTQPCCSIIELTLGARPYNFQKCCTMLASGTRVLGTGPPAGEASVPGNSFPLVFYDLPSAEAGCVNLPAGQVIYADLSAALVSLDGKTPCATIVASAETVFLDVLPIGVVYVPPGDPSAGLTGQFAPIQTFSSSEQTTNEVTTTNVTISGQTNKVTASSPITITATSSQSTMTLDTNTLQHMHSFLSQAPPASGAAGYPGINDQFVFIINPTYDVSYLTGHNIDPSAPLHPATIVAVAPHSPQTYEPGPQWELITASAGELRTAANGNISESGNAGFLKDLISSAPQAPVSLNPSPGITNDPCVQIPSSVKNNSVVLPSALSRLTLLQSVVYRLLAMDPMQGYSDPPCVLADPQRFTPIAMFDDINNQQHSVGPEGIPWSFCQYPGPISFVDTTAQTSTTIHTTTSKFTSGATMSFNPIQLFNMIAGGGGGGGGGGVGLSFEAGSTWELDTTTTQQSQNQFQLSTKGQFGSGTAPYTINPLSGSGECLTNPPRFRTRLYYDWQNLTILFWTEKAP